MTHIQLPQLLGKFKAMDPKVIFVIFGLAALVVMALDFALIARPQVSWIVGLNKKEAQLRTDISALTVNKQRMGQFRENLDKARKSLKKFKAMVHKADEVPLVLKMVSTMANEYGVNIDQLVPQKSDGTVLVNSKDGKYGSLSILVKAKTGYHQLARFLNRLEQESVFWQLTSVNIVADAIDPVHHTVKMQMKILIFGE